MMGYEMTSIVTSISEVSVDPTVFDIPADYKEVPAPNGTPK
jgi:hypothetical protein